MQHVIARPVGLTGNTVLLPTLLRLHSTTVYALFHSISNEEICCADDRQNSRRTLGCIRCYGTCQVLNRQRRHDGQRPTFIEPRDSRINMFYCHGQLRRTDRL